MDHPASKTRALLSRTAELAADYLEGLEHRPVSASVDVKDLRRTLGGELPEQPQDALAVIEALVQAADPGVVGIAGGRYFGFVIGGGLPAALAADWLTSTWDQNAGLYVAGPSAAVVEEVVHGWLAELFGLPKGTSFAVTTGCQMAHVTCLATARQAVLAKVGWDVNEQGLSQSPPLRVFVGERRHGTIDRALRFLGIGQAQLHVVPADAMGRMSIPALKEALRRDAGPTLICAQAGEVNSGAFDDLSGAADAARDADAWLHIDGAFGLWAAASPSLRGLVKGLERADSWATDGHKWLNVPYDCGFAFCAHPEAHTRAVGMRASYLQHAAPGAERDPVDFTPELSRRARGFTVYAALRSLGRQGVADLVDRSCRLARRFADALAKLPDCQVLNDVVLNQVLVHFRDDAWTREVVRRVQASGEAWMSGTTLPEGRAAMRISVINWQTTEADVDRTVAAIARASAS